MKILLAATALSLLSCVTNKGNKTEFTKSIINENWSVINDGVMGGLTKGEMTFENNTLTYEGTVSLENNGGFSSLKSPFAQYDLSNYEGIEIKIKGSGINLGFTLETAKPFYKPYFKQNITVDSSFNWQVIKLPFNLFKKYRLLDETGTKLDPATLAKIIRLGFITNEKRAGDFNYQIEYIKYY